MSKRDPRPRCVFAAAANAWTFRRRQTKTLPTKHTCSIGGFSLVEADPVIGCVFTLSASHDNRHTPRADKREVQTTTSSPRLPSKALPAEKHMWDSQEERRTDTCVMLRRSGVSCKKEALREDSCQGQLTSFTPSHNEHVQSNPSPSLPLQRDTHLSRERSLFPELGMAPEKAPPVQAGNRRPPVKKYRHKSPASPFMSMTRETFRQKIGFGCLSAHTSHCNDLVHHSVFDKHVSKFNKLHPPKSFHTHQSLVIDRTSLLILVTAI